MSKPVITLAMLAELVEASRVVYIKGNTVSTQEADRLNHALSQVQWRVKQLQDAVEVEVA